MSRLIAVLDDLDADPDLEPSNDDAEADHSGGISDDETSLGWTNQINQSQLGQGLEDDEPSLGAVETIDQRRWAVGVTDDRELVDEDGSDVLDEPHDAEPDEPSLGAAEARTSDVLVCEGSIIRSALDQTGWARSGTDDREFDPGEMGIADTDGLSEQCERYAP